MFDFIKIEKIRESAYGVVYKENKKLFLLFEYVNMVLRRYLDNLESNMDAMAVKCFDYQIFQGLLFRHLRRVIHRDLKPQNLFAEIISREPLFRGDEIDERQANAVKICFSVPLVPETPSTQPRYAATALHPL